MEGVGFSVAALSPPFCYAGLSGPVSLCYVVKSGPVWLEVDSTAASLHRLETGAVVGLSGVVAHWFKSAPDQSVLGAKALGYVPLSARSPTGGSVRLLIGHAPMEALALTNTINGAVVIPADGGRVARRIQRAVEGIEDELEDPEPSAGADAIVRRLSETILMNITRSAFAASREGAPMGALADVRLMRALAAAAKEPGDVWTVRRMADVAGMSRTAFAERFHALTGDTPLHMLARLRLRNAAEALVKGGGLEEAATLAGYGSAAAFVRAFRRFHHTTPARWRAAHRTALDDASAASDLPSDLDD